ncbi:MAG: hypothetical protein U1D70_11115 [Methylobacter sp.]|nr:hypothetical protein [Methylobacter sp.]
MKLIGLMLVMYMAFSDPVNAAPRIAVLNFELLDETLLPNVPKELTRTASMKPLLEQAISQLGDYEIVQINAVRWFICRADSPQAIRRNFARLSSALCVWRFATRNRPSVS